MKYAFIVLCTVISAINWFYLLNFGYTALSPLYTHFTYLFVHANIIHLALNMYVFWKVYTVSGRWIFAFSALLAVLSSFVAIMPLPTVGASGVVFAMIGFVYSLNKLKLSFYLYNFLIITIASVIGFYSNVNILLHLICLFGGIGLGLLYRFFGWCVIKL